MLLQRYITLDFTWVSTVALTIYYITTIAICWKTVLYNARLSNHLFVALSFKLDITLIKICFVAFRATSHVLIYCYWNTSLCSINLDINVHIYKQPRMRGTKKTTDLAHTLYARNQLSDNCLHHYATFEETYFTSTPFDDTKFKFTLINTDWPMPPCVQMYIGLECSLQWPTCSILIDKKMHSLHTTNELIHYLFSLLHRLDKYTNFITANCCNRLALLSQYYTLSYAFRLVL